MKSAYNNALGVVCLLLFLMAGVMADTCNVVIPSGQETINLATSYTVSYIPTSLNTRQKIQAVKITFPSDSGIEPNPAGTTCSPLTAGFLKFPPTCIISKSTGSTTLLIQDFKTLESQYIVQVTVGLLNSNVGKTVSGIVCQSCSDSTCTALLETISNGRITYLPLSVQDNVNVTTSEETNGFKNSTLKIEFRVVSPVVPYPSIYIRMPKTNANYMTKGTSVGNALIYNIENDVTSFQTAVKVGQQGSTTKTSVAVTSRELQKDAETGFDDLILFLGYSSTIPKDYIIEISLYPIWNPPSMNPVQGFIVKTGDANKNWIDVTNSKILFQTVKPGQFLNTTIGSDAFISSLEIEGNLSMVATRNVSYKFTLYLANDVPRKAQIHVQFPTSWPLDCTAALPGVYCNSSCNFSDKYILCDKVTNSYQFLMGFETQFSYTSAPGPVIFSMLGLTNPPTTAPKSFTVSSYNVEGNLYPIDRSDNLFTLTYTTGVITVYSITCNNPEINSKTGTWTINMTAQHDIEPTYLLRIQFPPELQVQSLPKCNVVGQQTTINRYYACNADPTFNQIVIVNMFSKTLPAMTNIAFEVNGITNPVDYIDPTVAKFTLEDSVGGGLIDVGSFTFPKNIFVKSYVEFFSAVAEDKTNGRFPVRYSFAVTPKGKIAKGAYLILEMPPQVKPYSITSMTASCLSQQANQNGFSNTVIGCRYDEQTNKVTIYDGFKLADSTQGPPQLKWYFDSMVNPRGLISSDMFNVTIYNANNKMLFQNINPVGPIVTMTLLPEPQSVTYSRNNFTNGQNFDLTFQIRPTNYIELNDKLTLKIFRPLHFTDFTKCRGDGYWVKGDLKCSISGDSLTVVIDMSINGKYDINRRNLMAERGRQLAERIIPSNSLMLITMTNISSTVSLRPFKGDLFYKLTTVTGSPLETANIPLQFQNKVPSLMDPNKASVLPNLWDKGQRANYTLIFFPVGYETNMQLQVVIDSRITIPPDFGQRNDSCLGMKGTDKLLLQCSVEPLTNTITLKDLFKTKEVKPDQVDIIFQGLANPMVNIILDSWKLYTFTYDGYAIDKLEAGLKINFFCQYPCATCNSSLNTQCFSCYGTSISQFVYYWQNDCLETCPAGYFEIYKNSTNGLNKTVPMFTCETCAFPCVTCGDKATDCLTCADGWLWYDVDHTCYERIEWYFPFVAAAGIILIVNWLIDCCFSQNLMTHCIVFCLGILEDVVIAYWLYKYFTGEIPGDRTLAFVSFIAHGSLNTLFILAHSCLIASRPTQQYKELKKSYKLTFYGCNLLAYLLNFKMSLILISHFLNAFKFSGTFSSDNWQWFNVFSMLYIMLVYLVFIGDFYLFFMSYGLRNLMSYISAELVIIQTIISLILMLEILTYCTCGGLIQKDLGKRVGLYQKGKGKKKRKAQRSGMGNSESSYDSEDDSSDEDIKYLELTLNEREAANPNKPVQPYADDSRNQFVDRTRPSRGVSDQENDNSMAEMLKKDNIESMAKGVREQRQEQQRKKEQELKKEAERLKQLTDSDEDGNRKEKLKKAAQDEISKQLEKWDGQKQKTPGGLQIVNLPAPVYKQIEMSRQLEGDQEYWLQNSAMNASVSNRSRIYEKEGSQIEFMEKKSAIRGNDLSPLNKSKVGTEREFLDNQSAAFSNIEGGKSARTRNLGERTEGPKRNDGLEQNIDYIGQQSADIGGISNSIKYDKSQFNQRIGDQYTADGGDISDSANYLQSRTKQQIGDQNTAEKGSVSNQGKYEKTQNNQVLGDQQSADRGNVSHDQYIDSRRDDHIRDAESAAVGEAMTNPYNASKADSYINTEKPKSLKHPSEKQKSVKAATEKEGRENKESLAKSAGKRFEDQQKQGNDQAQKSEKRESVMDEDGHSDESSEGGVANHDPFNGIQDALRQQEIMRRDIKPPETTSQEGEEIFEVQDHQDVPPQNVTPVKPRPPSAKNQEAEEENQPSARRKVKQVLYSDKSESSVDEMMEDTPSNYNIANGRLEGKSMGLKAILIYAKNQGIRLGEATQPLPQIQEAINSSGDEKQWKPMNQPLEANNTSVVVEHSRGTRPMEEEHKSSKRGTLRKPEVHKHFLEEDKDDAVSPLKKNNFI